MSYRFFAAWGGIALTVCACSMPGGLFGDDASTPKIQVEQDHYQIDPSHRLIVVNDSARPFDTQSGTFALCLAQCFDVAGDKGARRLRGEAYPVSLQGESYQLFWSELPMVTFRTSVDPEPDSATRAEMVFIPYGGQALHTWAGIKLRGASSLFLFPKKSFHFELWQDSVSKDERKESLFGMRKDGDWNLMSLFNEPLRSNTVAALSLWRDMGNASFEFRLVDVFWDHSYMGVYALEEPVDKKQLDLDDSQGLLYKAVGVPTDSLILEIDSSASSYTLLPDYDSAQMAWSGFEQEFPHMPNWGPLYEWVRFVTQSTEAEFLQDYARRVDIDNLIDYFIFINALDIWDNVNKNYFIARDKERSPFFLVPWDLDGSFSNSWNGAYAETNEALLTNDLFDRILADSASGGLMDRLRNRWALLRQDELSQTALDTRLQAQFDYMSRNGVYQRESLAWTEFVVDPTVLTRTSAWLARRLEFLDSAFASH